MKTRFQPNIGTGGRWIRGAIALACFGGAAATLPVSPWLALPFAAAGIFVAFEAARGWCALRACGVKTKF